MGKSEGLGRGKTREEKRKHLDTATYKRKTAEKELEKIEQRKQELLKTPLDGARMKYKKSLLGKEFVEMSKEDFENLAEKLKYAEKLRKEAQIKDNKISYLEKEVEKHNSLFKGLKKEQVIELESSAYRFKVKNQEEQILERERQETARKEKERERFNQEKAKLENERAKRAEKSKSKGMSR